MPAQLMPAQLMPAQARARQGRTINIHPWKGHGRAMEGRWKGDGRGGMGRSRTICIELSQDINSTQARNRRVALQ